MRPAFLRAFEQPPPVTPVKRTCGSDGVNDTRSCITPMAHDSAKSRLGQWLVMERLPTTGSVAYASPGLV